MEQALLAAVSDSSTPFTVSGPPGTAVTAEPTGEGFTIHLRRSGHEATVVVPAAGVDPETGRSLLAAFTAVAMAEFDDHFTFEGQPGHAIGRGVNAFWDEGKPMGLAYATFADVSLPPGFDFDFEAFEDGISCLFLDWEAIDSTTREDTRVQVSAMIQAVSRHQLSRDLYDFVSWSVAHETAEWVRVDGQLVTEPHARRNSLGLDQWMPSSRPWVALCRSVPVTAE